MCTTFRLKATTHPLWSDAPWSFPASWGPRSPFSREVSQERASRPQVPARPGLLSTLWSTISNLAGLRYAIRGYDNPTTQVIDLGSTDFTPGDPRQVPLSAGGFEALVL